MKKIFFAILLVTVCQLANAQTRSLFMLNYDMTLPVGSTSDFISKYQFRGMSGQYRHFVNPNIGLGFDVGYNAWFQKRPDVTYEVSNATSVTGTFYNFNRTWTLHVAGDYYFHDAGAKVRPYVGLGLGVNAIDLETFVVDYNIYSYGNWPFSISPEAGVYIAPPGSPVGVNVGVYFNQTTYDYLDIINGLSYVGFRVGFGWRD